MEKVKYQVMPPLSPDEYQELYEDIRANGVLVPVIEDEDGVIIDGHHRSKIASELGIPCPVELVDGKSEAEKRGMAFTLNLKRRHLNREQRRELIAESLKSDPGLSNAEHARRTGSSDKTVKSVRDDLVSTSEIPRLTVTKGADGRVRPASQPSRPEPEPAHEPSGDSEQPPKATALPQSDLDELNALNKPPAQRADPRRPLTDDALAANVEMAKATRKWHAVINDDRFPRNKNQVRDSYIADLIRNRDELNQIIERLENTY